MIIRGMKCGTIAYMMLHLEIAGWSLKFNRIFRVNAEVKFQFGQPLPYFTTGSQPTETQPVAVTMRPFNKKEQNRGRSVVLINVLQDAVQEWRFEGAQDATNERVIRRDT